MCACMYTFAKKVYIHIHWMECRLMRKRIYDVYSNIIPHAFYVVTHVLRLFCFQKNSK